jgi:AraC family transcriptional regulator
MIANRFPDLQWLKTQIDQRFQNRCGIGNMPLETAGFPSCVINAKTRETYRPDIMGPISLFLNIQGNSRCKVDGRTVAINEETYFITNRFQTYTLEIENQLPSETFNIHIGEYFSEQFFASAMHSSDTLLNEGKQLTVPTVAFHNSLNRRDTTFNTLIKKLQQSKQHDTTDKLLFEECLADLLMHLLVQHRDQLKTISNMPPLKPSTKLELYKRLAFATDFIHASYTGQIQLDEMANAACLSKFHFLRLFTHVYHVSPYQYIQQLRIEKAGQLLESTSMPVAEIADLLGFDNSNSFSRLFAQRTGVYPSQYREMVN